jgi:twitching motility protein PilT
MAEEPIAPEAVAPEPVAEEPIAPEPVVPEPVAEEPIVREPVVPEPVATEAEPEPMAEPRVVVVPLSRVPVRVASSQSPAAASTITVDEVLRIAAARGASAVYVVAQSTPMVRTDGEISALEVGDGEPLTQADIERIVLELSPPPHDAAASDAPVEWMCDVPGVGRVRCLTFHDHRGPGVILRMIPHRAISADQLGLSAEVQALCTQSDGLVLVTGPRASGKTTLMNAFVDLINRTRSDHVITIEPQIGFVHESRRCFISQREVRGDTAATLASLKAALREGPDVLFIEDVAAADIAIAAMQAAEAGRLVFASMSSPSTTAAIERLLESLPAERRAQAQGSLAASLRGVVSQVFVRRTKGGRLAAREVLLNTPAVAGLIQDGRLNQLRRAMESGGKLGMVLLSDALAVLVRDGTVHVTEAYRRAVDKEALLAALKREGIDTSFAEKLA